MAQSSPQVFNGITPAQYANLTQKARSAGIEMNGNSGRASKMGVEVETLKAGCCGLAGSWGFEADHHDLSMQIGEQGLLSRVRQLDDETIVVADGFSCKTQIEQGSTGRRALHVAQVLKLAHEHRASGPSGPRPERLYYEVRPKPSLPRRAARAAVLAGAAALAFGFVSATMRRREAP